MKNITDYNKFVKLNKWNKITEEMEIDTGGYGKGADSSGQDDMFFANVKGNLAGAENTLIGAAALKLFGFLKRKGMQMYMKSVLKPRLGRVYMNGILRYADKEGIGNFARKEYFVIKKIEDKEQIDQEEQVTFVKEQVNGVKSFVVGAEVKKKSGSLQEDGSYILVMFDANFEVKDGIITKADVIAGAEKPSEEKPVDGTEEKPEGQTQVQPSDDELEKYRKRLEEELAKEEAEGVEAEPDIIAECEKIRNSIKGNLENLDSNDIKSIENEIDNITNSINNMRKQGLSEIEELLKKKDLKNRDEIRRDKLVYEANILELFKLKQFLSQVVEKATPKKETTAQPVTKKPVVVEKPVGESHLYEAEAVVDVNDKKLKDTTLPGKVKTTKIGDELQEIAASGEAIDLNNEEFYKQFESEEARKGVTDMILRDKADIAKIQLTAERLIGGNAKQENSWKQMIENVKKMYSKFIITDLVDPYNVVKNTSEADLEKYGKQNNTIGSPGAQLKSTEEGMKAMDNENFKRDVEKLKDLKAFGKGDLSILKMQFSKGTETSIEYFIVEFVDTGYADMKFYRILATIDFDKIGEHTEETFNDLVHLTFPALIEPKMNGGIDANGRGIRGRYIVYGSRNNLSMKDSINEVEMMYLFSTKKEIDFKATEEYIFKIRNFDAKTDYNLPSETTLKPVAPYVVKLRVDETAIYKISEPVNFLDYRKYNISDANATKKMKGIQSFKK